METYADVAEAVRKGIVSSAREHFHKWGYYEDRLPFLPYVDEKFYLAEYEDVLAARDRGEVADATTHYVLRGYREGRRCVPAAAPP